MTRILLIAIVACGFAPAAQAQGDVNGKMSLTKLFNDAAAIATGSTVRVRCDGRDAALGTVVDSKGYILTKGSELHGNITVRLRDGSAYDAEYVGYHEGSDLGLLKIDAFDLAPVNFVAAKVAEAGNMVAAPGIESEPVAAGIISAGNRKLYGEEGVIRNGNKGYLGIIVDRSREKDGVFVGEYTKEQSSSPAKKAKILMGDQIVTLQEKSIKKFEDLAEVLNKHKPGDKVKVLVRRREKDSDTVEELSFEVKLGSGAQFNRSEFQNRMGSQLSGRRSGFPSVITTDVVIKPSDCGGPLVDLDGRVVGIMIARAGRVESWVLPKEEIQPILADLKANKYPVKKQ